MVRDLYFVVGWGTKPHGQIRRVGHPRIEELKNRMDADAAKAVILPELKELRLKITKDDAGKNQQFEIYLVDWYLHRVYDELNGVLTDAIQPPPEKCRQMTIGMH